MLSIQIDSININDIFLITAKTECGNKNLNRYGNRFLVKDKKEECILLESFLEGRKFIRWVNVYYDEHFYLTEKFTNVKEE